MGTDEIPWRSFAIVALAYAVALGAAVGVVHLVPSSSPVLAITLGNIVGTAVVFAFSRAFDNTSVYDPYWSVAPIVGALYLLIGPGAGTVRGTLMVLLISAWGWRLTLNWARGWRGLMHEDWRYTDIRKLTGGACWWASAFGLHLFPTLIVLIATLPVVQAFVSPKGFGLLDVVATLVTLGAIGIETLADEQLRQFRARPSASVCNIGVWRYSRHPNYFGEVSFWFGMWLFGVAAGAPWWVAVGPLAMTGLFLFASIPLMERHLASRRAGYEEHVRRTSMLIPLPPRREE